MKFIIEINCENAAFGENDEDRAEEIRRILRAELNDEDWATGETIRLRDWNGNTVGTARGEP